MAMAMVSAFCSTKACSQRYPEDTYRAHIAMKMNLPRLGKQGLVDHLVARKSLRRTPLMHRRNRSARQE